MSLGFEVEKLFFDAINANATAALAAYTPALVAAHYAEDGESKTNALYVEATVGDQLNGGCNPYEVDVKIHLRTLSTAPVATEDAAWEAVESVIADMANLSPGSGVFRWTRFLYSKSKAEREVANNMRHRTRHLPMEAKLI